MLFPRTEGILELLERRGVLAGRVALDDAEELRHAREQEQLRRGKAEGDDSGARRERQPKARCSTGETRALRRQRAGALRQKKAAKATETFAGEERRPARLVLGHLESRVRLEVFRLGDVGEEQRLDVEVNDVGLLLRQGRTGRRELRARRLLPAWSRRGRPWARERAT